MNKIILAQIDTTAGDIENNAVKILDYISKAKNENADMIIFPEFALTGCPFGDILSRHEAIFKKQISEFDKIAASTKNITVLVGFAEQEQTGTTNIYNSTAIFQNGFLKNTIRKSSISGISEPVTNLNIFEVNGEIYGILPKFNEKDQEAEIRKLVNKGVTTVIDCHCSPSRCGNEYLRNKNFSGTAADFGINYIFVNKAGYADNLCFDGASRIYDKKGNIILRAESFKEDFAIFENNKGVINPLPENSEKSVDPVNFKSDYSSDLARTYQCTVFAIKEYFAKNGFKKAVLGLSGGLDSSVCAVLLTDALGKENVYGVSMPSRITSAESKNDAADLAENLGINFFEIPLSSVIEPSKELLNNAFDKINADKFEKPTTIENLQARTRATILWSISNEFKNMLPIATSDKSEAYIGYATVNGDMSGGFAPIADITKTKLFALADYLNKTRETKNVIPQSVLEKPPGAELKINPKTGKPVSAEEDNMPYEFLDEIIFLVENRKYGYNDLINHKFYSEEKTNISQEEKEERINKFFRKSSFALYKWHSMPASVINDSKSINPVEYYQPIISKTKQIL